MSGWKTREKQTTPLIRTGKRQPSGGCGQVGVASKGVPLKERSQNREVYIMIMTVGRVLNA